MISIILSCSKNFVIGNHGYIPWSSKEEMKLFDAKTRNNILISNASTIEKLPVFNDRTIICVSEDNVVNSKNVCLMMKTLDDAINHVKTYFPKKSAFIIGDIKIYREALDKVDKIYMSVSNVFSIGSTFDVNIKNWKSKKSKYKNFTYYTLNRKNIGENQYLKILTFGMNKDTRNGIVKSLFNENMMFDLRNGFPLLTTKNMFFRGIVEELLFFLRGETNSKILEEKGVNIWKGNTNREFLDSLGLTGRKEGMMGPMYGYQWRFFNAKYDETSGKPLEKGIDQLKNVISTIKNNKDSRRIIMTDYNPCQVSQCVLYPCHSIVIQFYVSDGQLDMFCYNRSQDLFLGVPFNIASSALLLSIIAKICLLQPRYTCV